MLLRLRYLPMLLALAACEKGARAPVTATTFLLDKKDMATAIPVMTKGCDHDEPECCKWLAGEIAEGQGIAKNPARATELYRKACKLGSAPSCDEAAKAH